MKNPLIITLLGKSGSGKGTQAKFLVKKFGLEYIGSGDLLRARAQKNDFTGKKLSEVLRKGQLVPTPIITKLWLDRVEELKNKKNLKGFVMDGNPRKILEAYLIDEVFEWYGWKLNAVLVDISNKEAINRLTKRKICSACKEIIPYIGGFKSIKKCPKCGGKLVQRNDDKIGPTRKRIEWFKKEVSPIINYYKKTKRLAEINGEQAIERVFEDILKVI